jgi:hypothetical protein
LDRRLGGLQNRCGSDGKEKNSQPFPGLEPPIIQPVAQSYTTELSQFLTLLYEDVSKSFRPGRLERELQMVKRSANRYSCIAILWVSLVSFSTTNLCVASSECYYFFIDSIGVQYDDELQV